MTLILAGVLLMKQSFPVTDNGLGREVLGYKFPVGGHGRAYCAFALDCFHQIVAQVERGGVYDAAFQLVGRYAGSACE